MLFRKLLTCNAAPEAGDDSYATAEDTPLMVAAPGMLANDTDVDGDPLTAILVSGPTHGSVTLNANGSFGATSWVSNSAQAGAPWHRSAMSGSPPSPLDDRQVDSDHPLVRRVHRIRLGRIAHVVLHLHPDHAPLVEGP